MKKFFVLIMSSFLLFSCWSDVENEIDAIDILLLPFHIKTGQPSENSPIAQPFNFENETTIISQSGNKLTVTLQEKTSGNQFICNDKHLIADGLLQMYIKDGTKLHFLYPDQKIIFDLQLKNITRIELSE
jgi:hypothetical protein